MWFYYQIIKYLLVSKHRRGFGVHSLFVFKLITDVIEEKLPYYKFSLIEKVRTLLLNTDKKINITYKNKS